MALYDVGLEETASGRTGVEPMTNPRSSGAPARLIKFDVERHGRKFLGSGKLHAFAAPLLERWRHFVNPPAKLMQLRTVCCVDSEVYYYFLKYGCMVPHAFGITFSCDSIGADVCIGQNVTLSTSGKTMEPGGLTKDKPKIGNLARIYAGAVISGDVRVGAMSIVAANAVVTKDVPERAIVYGVNDIKPLQEHHYRLLQHQLIQCKAQYQLIPGLTLIRNELYIDEEWAELRKLSHEELFGLHRD
jgi:serine acetyltransferase